MSTPPPDDRTEAPAPAPGYEPPAIAWEEAYEPLGFGISCARQEGNPGCFPPGPTFT
jgi:hypothetical protein